MSLFIWLHWPASGPAHRVPGPRSPCLLRQELLALLGTWPAATWTPPLKCLHLEILEGMVNSLLPRGRLPVKTIRWFLLLYRYPLPTSRTVLPRSLGKQFALQDLFLLRSPVLPLDLRQYLSTRRSRTSYLVWFLIPVQWLIRHRLRHTFLGTLLVMPLVRLSPKN